MRSRRRTAAPSPPRRCAWRSRCRDGRDLRAGLHPGLIIISGEDLERTLFESISAFATCGLTSGLTEELPPSGLYVLSGLMFAGRIGIMTFATALTIRHTRTRYRYPEARPIIG